MPNPFGRPAGSNPAGGSVEVFEKKIWGELLEKIRNQKESDCRDSERRALRR